MKSIHAIFMIRYLLLLIIIFIPIRVFNQITVLINENGSNVIYEKYEEGQIESLHELYSQKIDPYYELIDGRGYFPYYFRSALKPMIFLDKPHSSSVTLNGRKFDNIDLDFDTYTDEVIYIDSTRIGIYNPLMVALNKDNVDSFEFYDGNDTITFRYFNKDCDPLFDMKDGYYEVVSDLGSKYLIRHSSILKKLPGIDEYIYFTAAYVNVGNGFTKITTQRQFIKIFGDRSAEVRRYIKESGIKIKTATKQQIMCVLTYHDSLKKQIK
jgi:hypothetical protein